MHAPLLRPVATPHPPQQQVARARAADKKRQRSEDTRRKILVGAVILAKVEHGEWPKERLRELMDKALTRADDRALFGLLPVPSEAGTRTGPAVETAGAPRAG